MSQDTKLVQAKVDVDLFNKFKEVKGNSGKTVKRMFEEWMEFEVRNVSRDWIVNSSSEWRAR